MPLHRKKALVARLYHCCVIWGRLESQETHFRAYTPRKCMQCVPRFGLGTVCAFVAEPVVGTISGSVLAKQWDLF
jgi:hypothetical protein